MVIADGGNPESRNHHQLIARLFYTTILGTSRSQRIGTLRVWDTSAVLLWDACWSGSWRYCKLRQPDEEIAMRLSSCHGIRRENARLIDRRK